MFEALKKYAVFTGRARRREYWLFILLYVILSVIANVIDRMIAVHHPQSGLGIFGLIVLLALFIPSLAVGIRRLHDTDRTGWWILIGFIPIIGGIVLLVFFCLDGTSGDNRFGPDPKASIKRESL